MKVKTTWEGQTMEDDFCCGHCSVPVDPGRVGLEDCDRGVGVQFHRTQRVPNLKYYILGLLVQKGYICKWYYICIMYIRMFILYIF